MMLWVNMKFRLKWYVLTETGSRSFHCSNNDYFRPKRQDTEESNQIKSNQKLYFTLNFKK